ncbi:MAG: thioredoxin domain-containing protein [Patescibacteria group bacterium]
MQNETPNELGSESEEKPEPKASTENKLAIPMAIVVAGAMIAGAIYFSSIGTTSNDLSQEKISEEKLENLRPISKRDHIRGDLKAPVKIIEYSDTECPFCKTFHTTMKRIYDEYGKSGEVAWIYRHSPLYRPNSLGQSLHSKALKEAEAQECAYEQGGNEKFWEYTDRMYEITPSNNRLDMNELPKIAEFVGLDVNQFNTCLNSGKYKDYVDSDLENAYDTGGGATPWNIIITKDGKKYPLMGGQPYESMKQIVEFGLK